MRSLLLLLPRGGILLGLRRGPGLMDLTGCCSLELFILQSLGKGFISTQHGLQVGRAMVAINVQPTVMTGRSPLLMLVLRWALLSGLSRILWHLLPLLRLVRRILMSWWLQLRGLAGRYSLRAAVAARAKNLRIAYTACGCLLGRSRGGCLWLLMGRLGLCKPRRWLRGCWEGGMLCMSSCCW